MEVLQKHFLDSGIDEIDLKDKIIPHFWKKGFKKIDDFEFLERQDLDDLDVGPVTKRRLLKYFSPDHKPAIKDNFDQDTEIYIRYIFCNYDLFANDIAETKLVVRLSMKLNEITRMICSENKIPQEETIELYSSHGYPLQNNEITGQGTLISWKLEDGDIFYVLRRSKMQPQMKEFVSLPELDHCVGQETLIIETPFHGSFSVNAYCDSPEDIAQKVYSATGIPVPFMLLYVRRGYIYERMTAFTELKDQDHIRVILRSPFEILLKPRSNYYGCQTYNCLVPQTKKGITKFFSILKFICSPKPHNIEYDFEKFLSYLMTFTDFPPLVYALQNLKEFSYLTISGWTALIEGFYLLFNTILDTFATVSRDQVFEYSDYILSMFIHKSHDIKEICTETQHCSLVCPLSGTRICQPVRVDIDMTQGPFDKENILAKIEGDNNFEQFGKLIKEQLKTDVETAKLLMYFPWETDKKVCVWTNPPKNVQPPKVCKKVDMSFKWYDMLHSLSELHILNPKGLYSKDECLTYSNEAHLIYFLGSTKITDIPVFYNACADAESNYQQVIHKAELERIGNSGLEMQVTSDIKKVIKKGSHVIPNYDKIRKSAVISPEKSIQWETEEAIVILLDQRGSMKNRIFEEMGDMKRLDAAKQLCYSFAIHSQAYNLHHALGLTIFGSEIIVKLKVTNRFNIEEFETTLNDITIKGSMELTTAVVHTIQQLKQFKCKRRIMCLTDGYNRSKTTYRAALSSAKEANVIIDTILLTFPEDNKEQKAFSHATGGVCVLPKTMQEALRYFELDAMLSLRERVPRQYPTDLSMLQNISRYPYETEASFKSTYIEAFHKVKTQSMKSHIDQLKKTPSNSQQQRIIRELREFMHNPHHSITVYPSQTRYEKWKVLMSAPDESAYSAGVFALSVEFPKKYPFTQPEIRFLTPIYHCNVSSSSGRICHGILGESYTPSTSMREILSYIYGLLMCPDIDTPLDSALAEEYGYQSGKEKGHKEYFEAASEYFRKARESVKRHASRAFDELHKELSG